MVLEVVFEQTNSETTVDFGQTTEVVPGDAPIYFAPVAKVDQLQDGALLTIQDKNGTTTAKVKNGTDGYSPTAKVERTETGAVITITDKDGTTTAEIKDGTTVEGGNGGNVDLTGYATEQWVKDGYQPKGRYLTEVPEGYAKTSEIPTKPEDIGAQPAGDYALKSEIPSVPVKSVNSKTGAVQLSASDVGADPAGTAAAAVSQHNTAGDAHNDIRLELQAINNRLTAFFDSDDQTLDELSEIVAYITSNKTLIESVTTSKVSVSDIINNLTTSVANKPLSAAQGVVLKGLIDAVSNSLSGYALTSAIPTKVSQLENDKEYLETSELTEAVNTALGIAKESGEFDGADGPRGKGMLRVTTSTTSASGTGPTGITIKYKIALATVKSEAGVDEVLVGDTVLRSYYTYPVAKVDASYVYLGAYTSIRGATGPTGATGADGYNPVRGTDYWTEADKLEMVQDVMNALGSPVLGSVEDDKIIVLSGDLPPKTYYLRFENADGSRTDLCSLTIGETTEGGEDSGGDTVTYTNVLPTSEALDSTDPYNGTGYKDGYYLSGSSPYEGTDEACVLTGYIPYTIPATGLPEAIYIKGNATWDASNNHCRMRFFASGKSSYSSATAIQSSGISGYFTVEELGENYIKLTPVASGDTSALVAADSGIVNNPYVRMSLYGTGADLIITIGEPIE